MKSFKQWMEEEDEEESRIVLSQMEEAGRGHLRSVQEEQHSQPHKAQAQTNQTYTNLLIIIENHGLSLLPLSSFGLTLWIKECDLICLICLI